MMRGLFLVSSALALAAPAAAKTDLASDDLSVQFMHDFAQCVADEDRPDAVAVLALDDASPDYAKRVRKLAEDPPSHCTRGMIKGRFSSELFTGGLAERLVTRTVTPADFAGKVAYDPNAPKIQAGSPAAVAAICVVRAEPAKAWAVFQTGPTSPEELAALQAIGSTLAGCVPSGQQVAFTKSGVRASLALASYRLTQAGAVQSAQVAR
jgi:hypothetical protein